MCWQPIYDTGCSMVPQSQGMYLWFHQGTKMEYWYTSWSFRVGKFYQWHTGSLLIFFTISLTAHFSPDISFIFDIFQDELIARDFFMPSSYFSIVKFVLVQICQWLMGNENVQRVAAEEVIKFRYDPFYSKCFILSGRPVLFHWAENIWSNCYDLFFTWLMWSRLWPVYLSLNMNKWHRLIH